MTALAMSLPGLEMWVVYRYPKDFPDDYVVRRWQMVDSQGMAGAMACEARLGKTLEEVRQHVPPYCVRLERMQNDDPNIVEVWL